MRHAEAGERLAPREVDAVVCGDANLAVLDVDVANVVVAAPVWGG
jgi:hypothetical protein